MGLFLRPVDLARACVPGSLDQGVRKFAGRACGARRSCLERRNVSQMPAFGMVLAAILLDCHLTVPNIQLTVCISLPPMPRVTPALDLSLASWKEREGYSHMRQVPRDDQSIVAYQRFPRRSHPSLSVGCKRELGGACMPTVERPFSFAMADNEDSWGGGHCGRG